MPADFVNKGILSQRDKNCAMCTIAGVLERDSSYVQSLVGASGQTDDDLAMAFGINNLTAEDLFKAATEKIWRLIYIQLRKATEPWYGYRSGNKYSELKNADELSDWMNQFPKGTRYAIWGCQEMIGLKAHWNAALKNETIQFIDYQYNYAIEHPPRRNTRFNKPYSEDEDSDDEWIKFVAFAYTTEPQRSLSGKYEIVSG